MGNSIQRIEATNEEKGEWVHQHHIGGARVNFQIKRSDDADKMNGGVEIKNLETGKYIAWLPNNSVREFARLIQLYEEKHGVNISVPYMTEEVTLKTDAEIKVDKKQAKIKQNEAERAELDKKILKQQDKIKALQATTSDSTTVVSDISQ